MSLRNVTQGSMVGFQDFSTTIQPNNPSMRHSSQFARSQSTGEKKLKKIKKKSESKKNVARIISRTPAQVRSMPNYNQRYNRA